MTTNEELSYIVELLVNRGTRDVPATSITSYLRTQAAMATAYRHDLIAMRLTEISDYWQVGRYDEAQTKAATLRDANRT